MSPEQARFREILAEETGEEGLAVCGTLTVAQAIAAMQRAARIVPEGFRLVPVEPTDEMIDAARKFWELANIGRFVTALYKAMLAASPPPWKE